MLLKSAEGSKEPLNLRGFKKRVPVLVRTAADTLKHGMGILRGAAVTYFVTTPRSRSQMIYTLPNYYPGCEIWCGWRIPLRFQFK